MSHIKYLRISVLWMATVVGMCMLPTGTAYAEAGATYCNTETGCCGWAGKIEGLCCLIWDCGGNDTGASCDTCVLAKGDRSASGVLICGSNAPKWLKQFKKEEAILLSQLLTRDTDIVRALRSLK